MAASSMCHVTKFKSSQSGFLNMTRRSLYSYDLHSPQISAQRSIFGMWWNRRVTTLMCSWHICSNCLLLSNPRKSKSMDVSSTVKLELTNSSRALYCQKSWKNSAWHTHTKTFVIPVCCRASIYFYFKKMKQHKSNKKKQNPNQKTLNKMSSDHNHFDVN